MSDKVKVSDLDPTIIRVIQNFFPKTTPDWEVRMFPEHVKPFAGKIWYTTTSKIDKSKRKRLLGFSTTTLIVYKMVSAVDADNEIYASNHMDDKVIYLSRLVMRKENDNETGRTAVI